MADKKNSNSKLEIEFISNLDVSVLKESVASLIDNEFEGETLVPNPNKSDRTMVRIFGLSEDRSEKLYLKKTSNNVLADETIKISEYLEELFSGKMYDAALITMGPKGFTEKKADAGPINQYSRKFYISLDSCGLTKVEDKMVKHLEGNCHEINNMKSYYSYNESETEYCSILIIDIVTEEDLPKLLTDPRLKSSENYKDVEAYKSLVRNY